MRNRNIGGRFATRIVVASIAALCPFALAGCNRPRTTADAAPPTVSLRADGDASDRTVPAAGLTASSDPAAQLVDPLQLLRSQGRFEEYIDACLGGIGEPTESPALRILQTEALLGVGRQAEAEETARDAARLALGREELVVAGQALKLWIAARARQGKTLVNSDLEIMLLRLSDDDPTRQSLEFWRDALGRRGVYRLAPDALERSVEIPLADAPRGTLGAELNAVQARADGVAMPLVFIDTGAQHTLMTTQAATAAGVAIGGSATHLVGFAGLDARPGLLQRLELGELTLYDVPVLVGDSAPLLAAGGQMSLGTDLMHHVRFTIDYPAGRVWAQSGQAAKPATPDESWRIPLWTFSQACIARGDFSSGNLARVLVDTGDRRGTFISRRWARHNLPQFQRATSSLVFKFKPRNVVLEELDLGNRTLADWPVVDTFPGDLERLDLVDVLVGHDLLGSYVLSIDLPRRMLELRAVDGPEKPERQAVPVSKARGPAGTELSTRARP